MSRNYKEQKSLDYVKQILATKDIIAIESEDQYAPYDLLTDRGEYLEVKFREFSGSTFDYVLKDGLILQQDKYEFLNSVKKSRYINVVKTKGQIFSISWDVKNLIDENTIWKYKWLSETTEYNKNDKKWKMCTLLPINHSKAIYIMNEDCEWRQIDATELKQILNNN